MLYNIYNIDERIFFPITIILVFIVAIGCSIYFYREKKTAPNKILSIWSISLSAIAFIAAFLRVDVYLQMTLLLELWQDLWELALPFL